MSASYQDYANGVTTEYGYDTADRLTSVETTGPGPATLASATYTLDDAGIRTQMVTVDGTHTFGYDDLYRLTSVSYPGGATDSFAYDATGNRTTANGVTSTYNDADQLTALGATSYTNDNNGNMTGRGTDSFTYDHENRLTSATVGANSFSATYDGDGLRATSDGTTWTWDAARGLPQVISDGSTTYVYGLDLISRTAAGGARRYYAQDGLGSTVALSNNSGTGVGTASYWGYGEQRTSTGESAAPFEFAGEQRDASTGLDYLRARHYDPDTGRFITKDPWGGSMAKPGTLNGYPYVLGSPSNSVDPSGRCVAPGAPCPNPFAPLVRAYEAVGDWLNSSGCGKAVGAFVGALGRTGSKSFVYKDGIIQNPLGPWDAMTAAVGSLLGGLGIHDSVRARGEHPATYEGKTGWDDQVEAILEAFNLITTPLVWVPGYGQIVAVGSATAVAAWNARECKDTLLGYLDDSPGSGSSW